MSESSEDVYLCQVDHHISCGACCGLYNRVGISKSHLHNALKYRTEAYSAIDRSMESILHFAHTIDSIEANTKIYPDFHHCPYVGLIGQDFSRVGCLLHPLSEENHGIDYRGLSYYGGMACSVYFCPASKRLSPGIKLAVQKAVIDWYLYGLVITEQPLLESFFHAIEKRKGRPLHIADYLENREFLGIFREFLNLKSNWPYRPESDTGLCHYFFKDGQYQKPHVVYGCAMDDISPYGDIFHELISRFESLEKLYEAESTIESLIHRASESIVNQ